MGKGSRPRPVNRQRYEESWERMFGKKALPEEPPRCEGCEGTGLVCVDWGESEDGNWDVLAICGDCNGRGAR